ncbi:MAG: carboxy-S-adenosyl-L-methionine synthase CmoA [Desulfobulbus sp.]|nr:MAG: carboxy-S-adenosyl-L-methionine synthase CmoA [Desulfobulbus sp.]
MTSDRLYSNGRIAEDFTFNDSVAEVFDDMLDRSIPFYQTVIELTAALIRQLAAPGSRVYDLGCSTGTTLLVLSRLLADMDLHFTGIDNAPAMIAKARRKVEMYGKSAVIEFRTADITQVELPGADIIVCNYTMQFIRPPRRQEFIRRLHESLEKGGMLIISEKVISPNARLNRKYIDLYYDFKRKQGYSELEIAAKREALENILIPFSVQENKDLLTDAGFDEVESFFQWINFASFLALKVNR